MNKLSFNTERSNITTNYIIKDKIKVSKESDNEKFNSLNNLFNNPTCYLNEENNSIIIGKISCKDSFNLLKGNMNKIKKLQSNKSILTYKLNPSANDLGYSNKNYKLKSVKSHGSMTNLRNSNIEYIDNPGIEKVYKQLEQRLYKDSNNQIFKDAANECYQTARSKFLNKKELLKIYSSQEEKLSLHYYNENKVDEYSKTISKNCNKDKEKLLLSMSIHSKIITKNNLHYKNLKFDWQMNLRNGEKVPYQVGKVYPIHTTFIKEKEKDELIVKPLITLEKNESENQHMTRSSIYINTLETPRSIKESYLQNSINTKANICNTTRAHYKPSIVNSLRDNTFNTLFLTGKNLLKIEKENAIDIKGKKLLYSIIEKNEKYKKEETYAANYDEVI